MKKPEISVIVPVYKAEKYIRRCVDSILSQTFADFELLLVDDGSPDRSGEICDEYADKDNRIIVFHNKNNGVSATREFGVCQASGNYIQFVDSDDWIAPSMLEDMYAEAVAKQADIVGCNFMEVYEGCISEVREYHETADAFTRSIIASHWGVVWKHLVKKHLYTDNKIHFPERIDGGEDYVVMCKLFLNAETVSCVNKALYYYNRSNSSSITSSTSKKKVQDQIDATVIVEEYLREICKIEMYGDELDIRKSWAKYPLLKRHPSLWLKTFPEADHAALKYYGIKAKLWIMLIKTFFSWQ